MHLLITGGAGFIGSHVVDAMLAAGHRVRVLDVMLPAAHGPGAEPALPADVEVRRDDVRDAAAVTEALDGVDAVVHLAAMVGLGVSLADLPDYAGINDLGTAVLLAAMAQAEVPRLVLASSMVVYGEGRYTCSEHGEVPAPPRRQEDLAAGQFEPRCPACSRPLQPGLVDEDARLDPRNGYAASKLAQEHLAATWARGTGGSAAALRFHNVFGPGMPKNTPYAGVASLFRSALERGEAPRVFEDGGQRRDFVDVRDVADANVAALEWTGSSNGGSLEAYNIGSGTPRTVGQMALAVAEASGGPAPVVTGEFRLGDVRHITASSAKAAELLDWRAGREFSAAVNDFAHSPLRGG